jgi:hypothetical protein
MDGKHVGAQTSTKFDLILKKLDSLTLNVQDLKRKVREMNTLQHRACDRFTKGMKACEEGFHLVANCSYNMREEISEMMGSIIDTGSDVKIV